MNQITNSPVRDAMRVKNEADAKRKEIQIQDKLRKDLAGIVSKETFPSQACFGLAVIFGIIGAVIGRSFQAFLVGAVVGAVMYIWMNLQVKKQNADADAERERLRQNAKNDIQEAYNEADRLTRQQIDAYDKEVERYCQTLLQKADTISEMVEHNTDMFRRMISHADASSNIRFVEADFCFKVLVTGVMYSYQSKYTNPQDDYNFNRRRFHDLNSSAECEGLAQALTKLTVRKMESYYPRNFEPIQVSHIDSEVMMHFKNINQNFVPAKNIF